MDQKNNYMWNIPTYIWDYRGHIWIMYQKSMANKALAAERAENHERIDHALEIMGSLARTLENVIYGMVIQELIQTMDMENVAPLAGSTICDGSTGAEPAKHLGKKK